MTETSVTNVAEPEQRLAYAAAIVETVEYVREGRPNNFD